jgi:hypothetical protein
MTLSPGSIMLKSAIAWPTCRCRRLLSLLASKASLARVAPGFGVRHAALLDAEDLDAHGVAVGVDVGLLGAHARGAHARVGQHQRQHVVGQGLLQVDVAARHALGDAAADEVVVHHLVQRRPSRGVDSASGTYRSTLISTRCSPCFSKSCTPMLIQTS